MTTEKTNTFRIVRRAYGKYEVVGEFTGTWSAAECHAMALQAERRDGEYSTRFPEDDITPAKSSYGQSGFDWL
jgi:hypothetical protein